MTTARSYWPAAAGSAASRTANVTRSATPAAAALPRASSIDDGSRSKPSTRTVGIGRRDRDRGPADAAGDVGDAGRRIAGEPLVDRRDGGQDLEPNEPRSHGRLKSPWASIMSGPYSAQSTPPPVRYASRSCGRTLAQATTERATGAIEYGLSGSSRGAAWPSGRR